ncbi:hypothetical protein [Nocardia sp. X0981]
MSAHTAAILAEYGFSYDHSQNYNDFVPFYARVGDTWTPIDTSGPARPAGMHRSLRRRPGRGGYRRRQKLTTGWRPDSLIHLMGTLLFFL